VVNSTLAKPRTPELPNNRNLRPRKQLRDKITTISALKKLSTENTFSPDFFSEKDVFKIAAK
jgi:hypothetical protein